MFFRRKPPTLQSLDARLTALEMLFDARRVDEVNASPCEGPRPVGDALAAALDSYGRAWRADQERRGDMLKD
jgi:hypothetical protein